jgi:adenine-specific DNA-methyltransferase
VLVAGNRRPSDGEATAQALNVQSMTTLERLADAVQREGWPQPQRSLHRDGWALERPGVLALVEKLRRSGMPLGEYVGERFYRGIVTGLNKAFVIDQATRDRLIAEDPRSIEIVKPWLRGRDVKRWQVEWSGLYLLWTYQGIAIRKYPAVLKYLSKFRGQLAKRWEPSRGQCEWYELRPCDYYAEFEKPKLIWPDIAKQCEFAFDDQGFYPDCTLFIVPDADLFLVGILNATAVEWFYRMVSPMIQQDFLRFKRIYLSQIPIPSASSAQRAAIEALVRKLLGAEGQGPQVAEWERELNALAYELYGLTEEEIGVVEDSESISA